MNIDKALVSKETKKIRALRKHEHKVCIPTSIQCEHRNTLKKDKEDEEGGEKKKIKSEKALI